MLDPAAKSIFLSRTFWAGAASVVLGLLPVLGIDPAEIDVADVGEKLYGVAVLVSGAVAIWGRARATRQVEIKTPGASPGTSAR